MFYLFRTVIIDDEWYSIKSLEEKLTAFNCIKVVASFRKVHDFLEAVPTLQFDIVFLDIHMPHMNGIELAAKLRENFPALVIIFLTAHRNYALEAFDVAGFDYLLKPISQERLSKTISRLQQAAPEKEDCNTCKVTFFKQFNVCIQDKIIQFRTSHGRNLLAYFLYHVEQPISPDELIEVLWPNSESHTGKNRLHTTLSYLKKDLKNQGLSFEISLLNKNYVCKKPHWDIDLYRFQEIFKHYENNTLTIELAEEGVNLYQEGLLIEEDFEWIAPFRLYYERQYFKLIQFCIQHYEGSDDEKALKYYEKLVKRHYYDETFLKKYLLLLLKHGHTELAIQAYEEISRYLEDEFDSQLNFTLENLMCLLNV